MAHNHQPLIIGAGLAGLSTALALAPAPCTLVTAAKLGQEGSSAWAQGGLAAALGPDDTTALHAEDTIKAGAGLCDPAIVNSVTAEGPAIIAWLETQGVEFDRDAAGHYRLGLEAAHSRRRIIHAAGDGTGAAITAALVKAVQATHSITVLQHTAVTALLCDDMGIAGIAAMTGGKINIIKSRQVVLATGGAGALWNDTTNPLGSWGCGLALAARAGAPLADLEFMQFHPTAIAITSEHGEHPPLPLASEALRGEGAILVDETGARFMTGYPHAELEPRDIVARAIWHHRRQGHKTFLDTRTAIGAAFPQRFPSIDALCRAAGIDPVTEPIPVTPAAHYHMGGVKTDAQGRTGLSGLWACGEVAATGLHGANRLASNSLLEAAIFGRRVAASLLAHRPVAAATCDFPCAMPAVSDPRSHHSIRAIMTRYAGLLRDKEGLETAAAQLRPLAANDDRALVALMIVTAALRRTESRGAHARTDYPDTEPKLAHSAVLTIKNIFEDRSHDQA